MGGSPGRRPAHLLGLPPQDQLLLPLLGLQGSDLKLRVETRVRGSAFRARPGLRVPPAGPTRPGAWPLSQRAWQPPSPHGPFSGLSTATGLSAGDPGTFPPITGGLGPCSVQGRAAPEPCRARHRGWGALTSWRRCSFFSCAISRFLLVSTSRRRCCSSRICFIRATWDGQSGRWDPAAHTLRGVRTRAGDGQPLPPPPLQGPSGPIAQAAWRRRGLPTGPTTSGPGPHGCTRDERPLVGSVQRGSPETPDQPPAPGQDFDRDGTAAGSGARRPPWPSSSRPPRPAASAAPAHSGTGSSAAARAPSVPPAASAGRGASPAASSRSPPGSCWPSPPCSTPWCLRRQHQRGHQGRVPGGLAPGPCCSDSDNGGVRLEDTQGPCAQQATGLDRRFRVKIAAPLATSFPGES